MANIAEAARKDYAITTVKFKGRAISAKIIKTIESCETESQLNIAKAMINNAMIRLEQLEKEFDVDTGYRVWCGLFDPMHEAWCKKYNEICNIPNELETIGMLWAYSITD